MTKTSDDTWLTLPLRLSMVLAKEHTSTPDGREIDRARKEMRELVMDHAAAANKRRERRGRSCITDVEVYGCKRHLGSLVAVISVPFGYGLGEQPAA